jgi:ABC-type lipoprotein export system ATPase subunit
MILSAHSLAKRYGPGAEYESVRNVSLELRSGEFISVVGRSGSGKSTLLAMLGTLTKPTRGRLLLDGADVWALPEEERSAIRSRRIGFVFQFPSLLANLTVIANVAAPALLGSTMTQKEAYTKAFRLLELVGLGERADAYPETMSGGEQRRVVIARALINSPPLLLADEPTSDLDEDTEADIMELLEDLQREQGFSLVLVTHNLILAQHATAYSVLRSCRRSCPKLNPSSGILARPTPAGGLSRTRPRHTSLSHSEPTSGEACGRSYLEGQLS